MKNKKDLVVILIIAFIITMLIFILMFGGKKASKKNDSQYFKINFESKYGLKVKSIMALDQSQVSLPILEYEDYEFEGWTLDGNKVSNNYVVTKDVTLVAKWVGETTKTYKVTFDTDGGSKISEMTVFEGDELNLPNNPTKKGYKFSHWVDKNNEKVSNNKIVKENLTLKAIWEKEEEKDENKDNNKDNNKDDNNKDKDSQVDDKKDESKDTYICQSGYELNGTKCVKRVKASSEKACPTGTQYDDTKTKCLDKSGQKVIICQNNNAVGPDDNGVCYTGVSDEEAKTECEDNNHYYYNNVCYLNSNRDTVVSCESGYELKNNECVKTVSEETVYNCDQGILDKDECIITINATKKNGGN